METDAAPNPLRYFTPTEIAAEYRVALITVNRWLTTGVTSRDSRGNKFRLRLFGLKVGGRWRVPAEAIAEFIKKNSPAASELDETPRESEDQRKERLAKCIARLTAQGMIT
ncbi:unnamed protein product [Gemmata massiliana]|uniref:Helix-turn-helix domain-containing protein n=1 Tax=Gemmata massiliana TaxID=1210884 RepID=A0A6P2D0I7_9BACT|nr:helix-turn-helix domain-containing protein [Gemmata massiliana]VTR93584.1 unnamed protein product [Gemmata massiliana]